MGRRSFRPEELFWAQIHWLNIDSLLIINVLLTRSVYLLLQKRTRPPKTCGEALRQEAGQVPELPRRPPPQDGDQRRGGEAALLAGRGGAARGRRGQDGDEGGGEGGHLLLQKHLVQGRGCFTL